MPDKQERRFFGTDGVRGIANQHPMTCEVALALGRCGGLSSALGPAPPSHCHWQRHAPVGLHD